MQSFGKMFERGAYGMMNDFGQTAEREPGPDEDKVIYDSQWNQLDKLERGTQSLHIPDMYT